MPECGSCTMCCKAMGVPELKKMPNVWCTHCAIGKGCKIYEERPTSCVEFDCLYRLGDDTIKLNMRPDKCKVVVAPTTNPKIVSAHVDAGYPDAWEKEPIYTVLQNIAESGVVVVIGVSNSINKIVLKKMASGIVGRKTITMSKPDETGMQWYVPEEQKRADGGANIKTKHLNINTGNRKNE